MVTNRESIASVGRPLCQLIIGGEGGSTKALDLAVRLEKMLARTGRYEKQYETNEERVLHRHFNLYRNKLAAAKTDEQRAHWQAKLSEQRRKIKAYSLSQSGITLEPDLDGL